MKHQKSWDKFISNVSELPTTKELVHFFELVLTPAEREKIALRYMIFAELIAGEKTQRAIATHLGVSIFNVTRGANQLKIVAERYKKLIMAEL